MSPLSFHQLKLFVVVNYGEIDHAGCRTVSLEEMQSRFGEESIWVWEILRYVAGLCFETFKTVK